MFFDDIYSSETKNRYLERKQIPIGTRLPYSYYNNGIPDEDVIRMFIKRREPMKIRLSGSSGYYKSTQESRIVWYLHKMGFFPLVLAPKGFDWIRTMKKGSGVGLLGCEYPDSLPIKLYVPSFCIRDMPKKVLKNFNVFSLRIKWFRSNLAFRTMEMSGKGASYLLMKIIENPEITVFQAIQDAEREILHGLKRSAITETLQNYINFKVFDRDYPDIDILSDWEEGKIPVVCFFEADKRICSLFAGYIISKTYYQCKVNSIYNPKIAVFDDAVKMISYDMDRLRFWSSNQGINLAVMGRYLGWHTMFATHSLTLLHEDLDPQINIDLVGKVGMDIARLESIVANPKIIQAIKALHYDPPWKQWIRIFMDRMRYQTYFPLRSMTAL